MAKKSKGKILKGEDAVRKFEEVFERMEDDASIAMKLLNKFSGGKLKAKYDKRTNKRG